MNKEQEKLAREYQRKFEKMLMTMSEDDRAEAYVDANCYRWPYQFRSFAPGDWDKCKDKHENPIHRAMFAAIINTTSDFIYSRKWWTRQLGRTAEEHAYWYSVDRKKAIWGRRHE